jgi:hypothetical protein
MTAHGPSTETESVRQGETTGHVRWMLRVSVVLAVVALAGVGTWYATHSHVTDNPAPQGSSQTR